MASFKPIYLIHGDDHGRVDERRSRLRALVAGEGAGGAEMLAGEDASIGGVITALSSFSLVPGWRFVIVDGVERWKAGDLEPLLEVIGDMQPETTLAMFAREDGRNKVPEKLLGAVRSGGGAVSEEKALPPWKLPDWTRDQAGQMGIRLDASAAKLLVGIAAERPQRIVRELEKIALAIEPGSKVDSELVAQLAVGASERKAWSLADAMVVGQGRRMVKIWLELEEQGERVGAVTALGARRLRDAADASARLDAGEPVSAVAASLKMPRRAADALVSDLQRTDTQALHAALVSLADLEADARGAGGPARESTLMARTLAKLSA